MKIIENDLESKFSFGDDINWNKIYYL
jgi:hypothetical protein